MKLLKWLLGVLLVLNISCESTIDQHEDPNIPEEENEIVEETNEEEDDSCTSEIIEQGKVYEKDGRTWLWAGDQKSWHFDITDWELKNCNLNYGLGRERFPAMIEPKYQPIMSNPSEYGEQEKCLVMYAKENIKVYPYVLMTKHEVINDVTDGAPVMIAYCVLADLAAVYTRIYCDKELTFALSGYTYREANVWSGLEAFILWDRDTESLWWPLIDKAVSGPLNEMQLEKHTESLWETKRWVEILEAHPDALVLKDGQTQEVPENWPRLKINMQDCD